MCLLVFLVGGTAEIPACRRRPQTMVTEEQIKQALSSVKYPGYSRDIVSFGIVKQISARDGAGECLGPTGQCLARSGPAA